jgi:hypothetical protein
LRVLRLKHFWFLWTDGLYHLTTITTGYSAKTSADKYIHNGSTRSNDPQALQLATEYSCGIQTEGIDEIQRVVLHVRVTIKRLWVNEIITAVVGIRFEQQC